MHTNIMRNIVLSSPDKEGEQVQIRVINGPFAGKEFSAKKVQETNAGATVYCYHVTDGGIKTYFHKKDVILL